MEIDKVSTSRSFIIEPTILESEDKMKHRKIDLGWAVKASRDVDLGCKKRDISNL